jgi:hydroxymethylglutaryl-CoA lyase
MSYPSRVRIVEVGPRDGLQNEKTIVDVNTKVELITQLREAGLTYIEAGSFVSPKWVPQMAGSHEVFAALSMQPSSNLDITYAALTPNMQGSRAVSKRWLFLLPHRKPLVRKILTAPLKRVLRVFCR